MWPTPDWEFVRKSIPVPYHIYIQLMTPDTQKSDYYNKLYRLEAHDYN